jgi:hypothetical protein
MEVQMRTGRPLFTAAVVAGVAVASTVSAMTPVQERAPGAAQPAARGVLICERNAASRRAFAREYGAAPVFITAHEAVTVRPSEPAWAAPRCMTETEHAKWVEAGRQRSQTPAAPRS